jgi:hypothetical protein
MYSRWTMYPESFVLVDSEIDSSSKSHENMEFFADFGIPSSVPRPLVYRAYLTFQERGDNQNSTR